LPVIKGQPDNALLTKSCNATFAAAKQSIAVTRAASYFAMNMAE